MRFKYRVDVNCLLLWYIWQALIYFLKCNCIWVRQPLNLESILLFNIITVLKLHVYYTLTLLTGLVIVNILSIEKYPVSHSRDMGLVTVIYCTIFIRLREIYLYKFFLLQCHFISSSFYAFKQKQFYYINIVP